MRRKNALCIAAIAFALVGCGPKQQTPAFNAQFYPECYDPIARLCADKDNSKEVSGAVAGAVVGGLLGALVGGIAKGNAEGALVGAAAGAVAGGAAGFLKARLGKIADQKQRLAEYQTMLGEEGNGLDLEKASVLNACKCYEKQIDLIKEGVAKKSMSKEDARVRMEEIRQGMEQLKTYWTEKGRDMDAKLADYDNFLVQEELKARTAAEKAKLLETRNAKAQFDKKHRASKAEQELAMKRTSEVFDACMEGISA